MMPLASDVRLQLRGKSGAKLAVALAISASLAAVVPGETANAAGTLDHASYGITQGGQPVDIYTMTNDHGVRVRFLMLLWFASVACGRTTNPSIAAGSEAGADASLTCAAQIADTTAAVGSAITQVTTDPADVSCTKDSDCAVTIPRQSARATWLYRNLPCSALMEKDSTS